MLKFANVDVHVDTNIIAIQLKIWFSDRIYSRAICYDRSLCHIPRYVLTCSTLFIGYPLIIPTVISVTCHTSHIDILDLLTIP